MYPAILLLIVISTTFNIAAAAPGPNKRSASDRYALLSVSRNYKIVLDGSHPDDEVCNRIFRYLEEHHGCELSTTYQHRGHGDTECRFTAIDDCTEDQIKDAIKHVPDGAQAILNKRNESKVPAGSVDRRTASRPQIAGPDADSSDDGSNSRTPVDSDADSSAEQPESNEMNSLVTDLDKLNLNEPMKYKVDYDSKSRMNMDDCHSEIVKRIKINILTTDATICEHIATYLEHETQEEGSNVINPSCYVYDVFSEPWTGMAGGITCMLYADIRCRSGGVEGAVNLATGSSPDCI